jgi:hypothetical protein
MKRKKSNDTPVGSKTPGMTSQPQDTPGTRGPSIEDLRQYYEGEQSKFLPIRPEPDWTEAKDKREYRKLWGETEDYRRDTQVLMAKDLAKVHYVLEGGINYLAQKAQRSMPIPPSVLTLREKVSLFTELLPASAERGYTLRFTLTLARILWLESERERLMRGPDSGGWLFPYYHLADSFIDAACDLHESLRCEHKDFDEASGDKEPPRFVLQRLWERRWFAHSARSTQR